MECPVDACDVPVAVAWAVAHLLPSNRVHLMQITTQDTAGHPWPTSLLSSPDLSDLCDDASRLASPLMAHQLWCSASQCGLA